MPRFFRKNLDWLGYLSIQPDLWKVFSKSLYVVEAANHYLDMEALNPDVTKITLPERRFQFLHMLSTKKLSARDVGLLPYQLQECYDRLKGAFAEYRWALADPKGREHRSPRSLASLKSVEMTCLVYAGILAHYAEDASQPLHATIFFDGRGPDGKPARTGVHLRFEIDFVNRNIKMNDIAKRLAPPRKINNTIVKEALALLTRSNRQASKVIDLDAQGKLARNDPGAIEFTVQCMAAGGQFLRNLWYSAWLESEKGVDDLKARLAPKNRPE
ncbi:MAG TPA: hypothetical protein EYP19_01625 [Desulfobacterales bacterium]|nr:hypothetical protein [Desulfobacterales bacterium]